MDFDKGVVLKGGVSISLAGKELELLRFLMDRRGKVVSREELLEGVWEYQPGVSSRTIDVHVAWLRHKLEDHPQNPALHPHRARRGLPFHGLSGTAVSQSLLIMGIEWGTRRIRGRVCVNF